MEQNARVRPGTGRARANGPVGTTSRPPGAGRGIVVALGLALGPAVALGLARFAYALLLPPMRTALHWSFATAGAMNTANAAGYLAGALTAAAMTRRWGARRVFILSMAATGVLLLASAATGNLAVLLVLRLLVGISGAASFVGGGALATQFGHGKPPGWSAVLLGTYFGGGGLGIVVSGLAVPPVLAGVGPAQGWRWGWVVLAAATGLSLLAAAPAARRAPEPATAPRSEGFPLRRIVVTVVAYTLFGTGYIGYMTFIVAYLNAGGAGAGVLAAFWAVLGLAAIVGAFVWGPMLGRLRGGRGVVVLMAIVTIGALLPVITHAIPVAFLSALLFGISFLSVVTAVTTVARTVLRSDQWTAGIATLTTGFAIGQCVGPLLSGVLADNSSGVRSGLLVSVLILAAGALVSAAQPDHTPPEPMPLTEPDSSTSERQPR